MLQQEKDRLQLHEIVLYFFVLVNYVIYKSCRYRQEIASFVIIISSVFADREVKLDGISFCSRDC